MIDGTDHCCSSSWYENVMSSISCLQVPGCDSAMFIRSQGNQLTVKTIVQELGSSLEIPARALLDSGCTGCTINQSFIDRHQMHMTKLDNPQTVYNADGTENINGKITMTVRLKVRIGEHYREIINFAVTVIKGHDIFLGYDWLMEHNPEVDWKNAILTLNRCPEGCSALQM